MKTTFLFIVLVSLALLTGCGDAGALKALEDKHAALSKQLDETKAQLADAQKKLADSGAKETKLAEEVKHLKELETTLNAEITRLGSRLADKTSKENPKAGMPLMKELFGGKEASRRGVMKAYFFDLESNEMFEAPADELPPITRENGHKAFKAYVFSCSDCSNEKDRFVGYYEGFTADYKEKRAKTIEAAKGGKAAIMPDEAMYMEEGFSKGRLISQDGKTWVTSDSPEGIQININLSKACDSKNGRLKPCYPGMK